MVIDDCQVGLVWECWVLGDDGCAMIGEEGDAVGRAGFCKVPDAEQGTCGVEDLHTGVCSIAHINVILMICGERMGKAELAIALA